jgi:hypothetical protein
MRTALAIAIVLAMSPIAGAQTIGLPLPQLGLPLPQIGLPLPATGLPPLHNTSQPSPPVRMPPVRSPLAADGYRPVDRNRNWPRGGTFVYFVPPGWDWFGVPVSEPAPPPPPPAAPPQPETGSLIVDVQPGVDARVFIDGYLAGTLDDLGGALTLSPGIHQLELYADGYEPRVVDVQIVADRLTRYRGVLAALSTPATPAVDDATPAPSTIYVIPGCYVGNLPPRDVRLPAGCDPGLASAFPSRR